MEEMSACSPASAVFQNATRFRNERLKTDTALCMLHILNSTPAFSYEIVRVLVDVYVSSILGESGNPILYDPFYQPNWVDI